MAHKTHRSTPKRGRDLYHIYIISYFFVIVKKFFQKERSRSYTVSAYSAAGEHVLPTTLAAHFRGFPTPISHCRYSVRELVPHDPSHDSFWLVRWVWHHNWGRDTSNTPQKAKISIKFNLYPSPRGALFAYWLIRLKKRVFHAGRYKIFSLSYIYIISYFFKKIKKISYGLVQKVCQSSRGGSLTCW